MLSRPGDEFNVIIDSLMKSQFLWWAAKNGGPAEVRRDRLPTRAHDRARLRACRREYLARRLLRRRHRRVLTHRGSGSAYSVDSTWARGQAWAMLGFAAAYGETGDAGVPRGGPQGLVTGTSPTSPTTWSPAGTSRRRTCRTRRGLVRRRDRRVRPPRPRAPRAGRGARRALRGGRAGDPRVTDRPTRTPRSGSNPAVLLHGTYSWLERGHGPRARLRRCLLPGGAAAPAPLRPRRRAAPARPRPRRQRDRGSGDRRPTSTRPGRREDERAWTCASHGTQRVGAVRVALRGGDYPRRRAAHPRLHGRQALAPRGADDDERRVGGVRDAGHRTADGSLGPPGVQRYDARRRQSHRRGGGLPAF